MILEKLPKVGPTLGKIFTTYNLEGFQVIWIFGRSIKTRKVDKINNMTPENESSQVGTQLGKNVGSFIQGFHTLVEQFYELVQESSSTGLS